MIGYTADQILQKKSKLEDKSIEIIHSENKRKIFFRVLGACWTKSCSLSYMQCHIHGAVLKIGGQSSNQPENRDPLFTKKQYMIGDRLLIRKSQKPEVNGQ